MSDKKLYYKSKYTEFQTTEPPYTDKIYYKEGNKTLCIIHIDENWNMWGEVKDPFNIPIDILKPKYKDLTQAQCEELIMRHMPPLRRTDIKKKYNMEIVDYAIIMYKTRLITCIDNYWAAWSEDDKAEEYHPKYNKDIMKARFEDSIKLDEDPEDKIMTPYIKIDFEKEAHNYHEPNHGKIYINPEFKNMKFE